MNELKKIKKITWDFEDGSKMVIDEDGAEKYWSDLINLITALQCLAISVEGFEIAKENIERLNQECSFNRKFMDGSWFTGGENIKKFEANKL